MTRKEVFYLNEYDNLNVLTITDKYVLLSNNIHVIGKCLSGNYPLIGYGQEKLNEIRIGKIKVEYLKQFIKYLTDDDKIEIWINKNKDKSLTLNPLRSNSFFLCPIIDLKEERVKFT